MHLLPRMRVTLSRMLRSALLLTLGSMLCRSLEFSLQVVYTLQPDAFDHMCSGCGSSNST